MCSAAVQFHSLTKDFITTNFHPPEVPSVAPQGFSAGHILDLRNRFLNNFNFYFLNQLSNWVRERLGRQLVRLVSASHCALGVILS